MAIVVSSVVGKLKGRAGDLVFRNQKGKNIMSLFPKTINVSKTPQAIIARNNFAVTIKLAKAVNSLPALKEIWTLAEIEGSNSFQKIIKNNLTKAKNGCATLSNTITPAGLPLILSSAMIQNNVLNINFNLPSTANLRFPAVVFVFLYFNKNDDSIFRLNSELQEASSDKSYNVELSFDSKIDNVLNVDPNPIIYLAVAGSTVYKKKTFWTDTASVQI